MASTPEKKVKDAVAKILKEYGAYYFYPATGGFGRSGVPDIIVCYKGNFIGIECKAKSNTPTALQLRELQNITTAGGSALIINEDNIFRVKEILDESI
jgi:Holliday junction resolvase